MKRLFAIALLSLHLFYIGGYSLFFLYFINQSDTRITKQIYENKVNDAKLILVKVPVNMPTIQDWDEYEQVVGQIQLKDAFYNYVRLRMTRDTMYFICMENTTKTRLVKANIVDLREMNDAPVSKKTQTPVTKKINTLSEYNLEAFNYQYKGAVSDVKNNYQTVSFRLSKPFIESPVKPPNFIG